MLSLISIAFAFALCRVAAAQSGNGIGRGTEDLRWTLIPSFTLGLQNDLPQQQIGPASVGVAGEYAFRPGNRTAGFSVPVGGEFRAQNSTVLNAVLGGPRAGYRWTVQGAPFEVYGAVLGGHASTNEVSAGSETA